MNKTLGLQCFFISESPLRERQKRYGGWSKGEAVGQSSRTWALLRSPRLLICKVGMIVVTL